jgi:hypothetical protein
VTRVGLEHRRPELESGRGPSRDRNGGQRITEEEMPEPQAAKAVAFGLARLVDDVVNASTAGGQSDSHR